ncbi:MAG: energy transducer TonB [Candidatus Eremiobacteraeota bacterium]|nr:energy transducer TonB [Candidatus Eremiobacteraeota bacterium]
MMVLLLAVAAAFMPIPGASLGGSIQDAVRSYGIPTVVTTDIGHVWTFERRDGSQLRLTSDDNGGIRMIDLLAAKSGRTTIALPTTPTATHLQLDALTSAQADVQLSAIADFSGRATFPDSGKAAVFRAYKLSPTHEAVLLFANGVLREAFYGERAQLARSGLLPGAIEAKTLTYKAPVLQRLGGADYTGGTQGASFVRIAVGQDGKVTDAAIFISSGSDVLDRIAVVGAKGDVFTPATIGGAPVSSVYFYKERFVVTSP